ncbi:MAG: hypothetical protein K2K42_03215 [Eubacterium sp.]|nr:hypothetical protein [Eubacterium sp.]
MFFIDPCAVNMSVSALACAIAEGKSMDEINALGAFFSQLGDSLETMAAVQQLNQNQCNN